jgi:PAS domain S-box-containing protein
LADSIIFTERNLFMAMQVTESTEQFLSGGGEMGKLIRSMDWSKTALGPIESWPQSLRTSVSLCLSSTFPILIAWGPETIQIYNDSYRPICGALHPASMGQNFRVCWESALPVVGDKFSRGEQGEGTYITDQRMFLDRYGYLEEAFMTFSFAPIRDESGGVGGIFHPITETTEKMLSGRRTQVLRDLGAIIGKAKTVEEIGKLTDAQYSDYELDLPFMLFYKLADNQVQLISSSGITPGTPVAPANFDVADSQWPLSRVLATGEMLEVNQLSDLFGPFHCGPYELAPHSAMVLPIRITGQTELFGFIVAGVSACRALDQQYLNFYDQLAGTYNTAVSNVYAYEQEQKRAEALAEIDRSKTAFFSNISHEFRTPLTLMLGPLEDLLQNPALDTHSNAQVEATHRNALRLLKLVNNLLDYSRVEAGRIQAVYEPLDLSELTIDLASSFRSIIEKTGMKLLVNCSALSHPVYIDRQMWEKIVLNVLSNAFKYTLEGTITVNLRQEGNATILEVSDTGIGIPEKELPHMFQRFHRVENAGGRTHEGTGIGLSLVHELVLLHGGTIKVSSVEKVGSTFKVEIPAGKAHLPSTQVIETSKKANENVTKGAFIKEAYSLLQEEAAESNPGLTRTSSDLSSSGDQSIQKEAHILIVDDNADMRAYLKRLLEPFFTIHTSINGVEALKKIKGHQPSLVLSDIMMPVMDGKELLRHIRADEQTLRLPVIFLSARAGEEARIDGLEAGADDYLVKPFSAAELLTKIRAQINISKARGHAEKQLRVLLTEAPVAMAIYRGKDYIIELANRRMLAYWGRQADAVLGRPAFTALPELENQGFRKIMDQVYQTGQRFVASEIPVTLHRFGQEAAIFINLTLEPLKEENGQISGMIAVASDVTEQVSSRQEIEKINNTLQLAMDASNMGIWRTDWGTDILHVSETARIIHGLPLHQELSFLETTELIIPEHREKLMVTIQKAVANKGSFDEDYQIQPLGSTNRKWINSTGMVELNETGEVKSVIGTILDITESKEDEIRKNDFIAMVSHELKTPLTSLSGYTELGLMRAKSKGDTHNTPIYEKLSNQIRKMKGLINGFLNVARLESGKIGLDLSTFRLDRLVTEIVEEIKLTAYGQQFDLTCEPLEIIADHDKISTVITNLLSNTVKYAKNKPVEIKCHIKDNAAYVTIKDKGIGINPNDLDKIFDRFYRVENKESKHIGGFGIGLYLCSEIIKRHGGEIWAESEYGSGSTFNIKLPLSAEQTVA